MDNDDWVILGFIIAVLAVCTLPIWICVLGGEVIECTVESFEMQDECVILTLDNGEFMRVPHMKNLEPFTCPLHKRIKIVVNGFDQLVEIVVVPSDDFDEPKIDLTSHVTSP